MISFEDVAINLDLHGEYTLRVNVSFEQGDFVLVVGPNGSGKTSFLDLIAGVRVCATGMVKGIAPNQPVAYAVQEPHGSLLPWLSIISNILLPSSLGSSVESQESKARSLLDRFGILHRADDFPYRLSGGEKQAINFIRTICTPASIRLFDEVTASLHSSFKHVARDVIPMTNEKTITFFISHDITDLVLPFNRFVAIKGGAVHDISNSDAEELMSHV
ncbi:MAG: ATP-binding cassette domain-containing protein [Deltaproteobacteria bacterium]|nr:ATP-binding cassette domain-containing protein [Deltaproteobacteria bacterium]